MRNGDSDRSGEIRETSAIERRPYDAHHRSARSPTRSEPVNLNGEMLS